MATALQIKQAAADARKAGVLIANVRGLQHIRGKHLWNHVCAEPPASGYVSKGNNEPKLEKYVEASEKVAREIADSARKAVRMNEPLMDRYYEHDTLHFTVNIIAKGSGNHCQYWGGIHELMGGNPSMMDSFESFTNGNLEGNFTMPYDHARRKTLELGSITIDLQNPKVVVVFPDKKQVEYNLKDVAVACAVFCRAVWEFVSAGAAVTA